MKIKILFSKLELVAAIIFFCATFFTCSDLDLAPLNVIQDKDIFTSENGMDAYMSRMYSLMPFEDFKWSPMYGFFFDYNTGLGIHEGFAMHRDMGWTMTTEPVSTDSRVTNYWTRGYSLMRDANRLIETLPEYRSSFTETMYGHYLGEAYFVRAMVLYALAKRYGGMPIVTEVLKYPENSAEDLEVPRATEEETWNQVLADFDKAISTLAETSPKRGYSNKYVALGFKSEAMLFAGCVAKYNTTTGFGTKTNVRVIGFDPSTAAAASKKYLREAYNAAREVMKSQRYSLYRKKTGDRQAQYENMVEMFFDDSSSENLYIKEYYLGSLVHGFDSYNIPVQYRGSGGVSATVPTLDYVELFDGIDKNADGTIKVFDDNGKYRLFDHPMDLFKNVEPRLRAYVILPYDIFKGEECEIRRGVYTGDVTNGISPLMVNSSGVPDYSWANLTARRYNAIPAYTSTPKTLYLSGSSSSHERVTLDDGTVMNASGLNGPFSSTRECSYLGFNIRKYMNPNMARSEIAEGRSTQHFVLMRYGEILLNAAEAACELALAGEAAPSGDDFSKIATDAIADIRDRAGAEPLKGTLTLNQDGLQIIRKERKKELAFENKIVWDIRRWRTQHSEVHDLGRTMENGVLFRGLYPFYSTKAKKYFFDARLIEFGSPQYTFRENQYYFAIPGDQVSKSPVIDQQPNR
jgi:hypothetical protein